MIPNGPGVNASNNANVAMAPTSGAIENSTNLTGFTTPTRNKASVMFGFKLKRPPVILVEQPSKEVMIWWIVGQHNFFRDKPRSELFRTSVLTRNQIVTTVTLSRVASLLSGKNV